MSLRAQLYLYGWRLRAHPLQELLAGAGIAVGVALLFAVQVANTSITGSTQRLVHGITGRAQLQIAARDDSGLDARLLARVRGVAGVAAAAPSLERRAIVEVGGRRGAVQLVGTDRHLAELSGELTRDFGPNGLRPPRAGVMLAGDVASALHVASGATVTALIAGRAVRLRVGAILGADQVGSLAGSPLAIAPLAYLQRIAGTPGRLSRIFVLARPGREDAVRAALRRLAGERLQVSSVASLVDSLRLATKPNDQSTTLFSAISGMVGLLFAFNAMLLTMPERRRFVAELRVQGFTVRQVVTVLGFQALVLGLVASLAGLAIGDELSRTVFHAIPTYLSFTFPIGDQRVVPLTTVLVALATGTAASLLAACRPLADLAGRRALDAVYEEHGDVGEALTRPVQMRLVGVAAVTLAVATASAALAPETTIVAMGGVLLATLLAMPILFAGAIAALDRLARRVGWNMLIVAIAGARSAMARSVAVAAIAALAVFGNVALGGAREDLVRSLHTGYAEHLGTADVWVTTAGRSLTTDAFRVSRRELARLRAAPEIARVRLYRGGMYDWGSRRIWLIGRPPDDRWLLPRSQVIHGDVAAATARIRRGGWVAVSSAIAAAHDVGIGDVLPFPTPSGITRFRVAAIVTNLSWGPGAMVLNGEDYRRLWHTESPSALEIDLAPHVSAAAGKRAVVRSLDQPGAFDVQTAAELDGEFQAILRDGLTRLTQISSLMLIAAVLALAAALGVAVWQRRPRLASYKVQGFKESQLRRVVLLEAAVVIAVGCILGALTGAYAHFLCNRWLELTTGFPARFSAQGDQALTTLLLIGGAAAVTVALLGRFAARVAPHLSFRD